MSALTPSQTVGPYFRIGLDWPEANRLVGADTPGQHILLRGQVLDGDGVAVPDAMIEIWQADAAGVHHGGGGDAFRGAGRCGVDADGGFVFETVKPGAFSDADGAHAPHLNLIVFARGLLTHLYTRVYFEDEAAANAADPVLGLVPADRRATLVARREGDHYRFDLRLQGAGETVFFDV
ncbi:MAG: protocatechuate 3,4-dioxygenase subunit alpha [Gammaproteobacteria bacterium]|nr:protocatechuate 3,4-dioxygenase subunit alpha [Gammaproteobacteria bacterium]MCP5201668.1 protocatechuate 3,4-dioxygenase subunit alpha [Gammaproteobacteria bacterium]